MSEQKITTSSSMAAPTESERTRTARKDVEIVYVHSDDTSLVNILMQNGHGQLTLIVNPNSHLHRSVETSARLIATELYESCKALLGAMEMQLKREAGEFHIPQHTLSLVWNEVTSKARAVLAKADGEVAR